MGLENESLEIIKKIQESRKRKEDYTLRYSYYSRWWELSGIENLAIMPPCSSFKYVLQTSPFDFWKATIPPESLIGDENDKYYEEYGKEEINNMIKTMKNVINFIEGEEPHTVAFTSIPMPSGDLFELVGLAKISNNGTSFVFCNDLNYLKYLKSKGL